VSQHELRFRGAGMPRPHDLLDGVRQQQIVSVEEHHDAPAARAETCVECGRVTAVCLEDGGQPVAVAGNHIAGIVGRAIIDDDHFDRRIGLRDRAVDRRAKKTGVVEIVDNDADERPGLFRLRRHLRQLSSD